MKRLLLILGGLLLALGAAVAIAEAIGEPPVEFPPPPDLGDLAGQVPG